MTDGTPPELDLGPELPSYHQETLAPLPGEVGMNTAAYGGGSSGAFLLALAGIVRRRRARKRMAQLDD